MPATALVLLIPESEPLVREWRLRLDPVAANGMPAHVTVLYPFIAENLIDTGVLAQLQKIFEALPTLTLTFRRLGRFPNALWLAPEPAEPIQRMTKAVVDAFPDYPPYGGAFGDSVPHLTVAQGDAALLHHTEAALTARLKKEIVAIASACSLFAQRDGRWSEERRFPLHAVRSR